MNDDVQPNSLTSKDVADFSKEVGKDTIKQAIIWTLASAATKGLRELIERVIKSK